MFVCDVFGRKIFAMSGSKSRIQASGADKAVILHISSDFPDALDPQKTKAVLNLVEGTPEYRHVVYSLNRVNGWGGLAAVAFGEDRIAISYSALPKGIFWEKRLPQVAAWIAQDLERREIRPELIEAHKFTVEGVIAHELARIFGCPFVCDIQGGTDTRILKRKKGLRDRYRLIAKEAVKFFPYAPWAVEPFEGTVGLSKHKCINLPVVPGFDDCAPSPVVEEDRLVSVFHLDSWKRKNIEGLIEAAKTLRAKRPGLVVDIYGRGSPKTLLRLERMIKEEKAEGLVRLMGPVAQGDLVSVLQSYAGFVLPSKEETYGLVYAEALFCGLPILYYKDQALSGYVEPSVVGYGCDPFNATDIAAGMEHLLTHQAQYKENIAKLQNEGGLDQLKRDSILNAYRGGIEEALKAVSVHYRRIEKVCFAASGGGHLRQLLQLSPLREEFPNYYFLTEKTSLGESLLSEHRALFVPHFAFGQRKTEGFWPFFKSGIANFFSSSWHFLRERPDVVISTGAGAAFFTIIWAWLFRRKIVYIESIARVTEVSLFGKLAARFSGLTLVQWPGMVEKMQGATYCSPLVVSELKSKEKREGILVTVGTIMPFDRMVRGIESLLKAGQVKGPVAVQTGETSEQFEDMETFSSCPFEELNTRMERADVVVCHGGSGSILGALKAGAHVVAMARNPEFNEHYDDHQRDITSAFEEMDLISVAQDENDLLRAIEEARGRPRKVVNIDPSTYVQAIRRFVTGYEIIPANNDRKKLAA